MSINTTLRLSAVLAMCLTLAGTALAQTSTSFLNQRANTYKRVVIDESIAECVYISDTYDSDLDHNDTYPAILQVGRKYVKFDNYGDYMADSTLEHVDMETLTTGKYHDILRNTLSLGLNIMLIDRTTNHLSFTVLSAKGHQYCEEVPKIEWSYVSEECKILGYDCRQAKCCFRGREWTVWYAPAIKIPFGPWKLSGLPGLILKAEDSTGDISFEAIAVRTKPSSIIIPEFWDELKTTSREEFNKIVFDYNMNCLKGCWEAYYADPVNNFKPALKHRVNVPLELE